MSLTSYRAAPPRDKPLPALQKSNAETGLANAQALIDPVRRLPEKAPGPKPLGRGRYVPTWMRFGKARERSFSGFYAAHGAISRGKERLCLNLRKARASRARKAGNAVAGRG